MIENFIGRIPFARSERQNKKFPHGRHGRNVQSEPSPHIV
jgi:hypothetical protein